MDRRGTIPQGDQASLARALIAHMVSAWSSVAKVERRAYGVHLSIIHRQTGRLYESPHRCSSVLGGCGVSPRYSHELQRITRRRLGKRLRLGTRVKIVGLETVLCPGGHGVLCIPKCSWMPVHGTVESRHISLVRIRLRFSPWVGYQPYGMSDERVQEEANAFLLADNQGSGCSMWER